MRRRVSGSTETEGCPVRVTLTDALRLSFQALDSRPPTPHSPWHSAEPTLTEPEAQVQRAHPGPVLEEVSRPEQGGDSSWVGLPEGWRCPCRLAWPQGSVPVGEGQQGPGWERG